MAEGFEQAPVVGPVHPFEGGELDCLAVTPRAAPSDELRLVQPDDGLGQGVVAGVAHAAPLREALGVAQREGLDAPVAVVDEPFTGRTALMQSLFEDIEGQVRAQ